MAGPEGVNPKEEAPICTLLQNFTTHFLKVLAFPTRSWRGFEKKSHRTAGLSRTCVGGAGYTQGPVRVGGPAAGPAPAARATPSPVLSLQGAANYRSAGFASHAACPCVPLGTRWLRGSDPPTPASPRFTVCELLELEQPSPKIASTDIETNSQKRSDIHAGHTETGKAPCARFTRSGE